MTSVFIYVCLSCLRPPQSGKDGVTSWPPTSTSEISFRVFLEFLSASEFPTFKSVILFRNWLQAYSLSLSVIYTHKYKTYSTKPYSYVQMLSLL